MLPQDYSVEPLEIIVTVDASKMGEERTSCKFCEAVVTPLVTRAGAGHPYATGWPRTPRAPLPM